MSKKFPEYNELDLSAVNKEMLEKWDTQDIFQKSLTTRKGHPEYVFYEGRNSNGGVPLVIIQNWLEDYKKN